MRIVIHLLITKYILRQLTKPFESVVKFSCSYLGTILTTQNFIHEEINEGYIAGMFASFQFRTVFAVCYLKVKKKKFCLLLYMDVKLHVLN